MKTGTLFIISAPSGGGKTTLVNALLADLGPNTPLERIITYTTKQPRAGDVQGKDYHFIDKPDFEKKIKEGYFIEYSDAYDNYYGSPLYIVEQLKAGVSLIGILDRDGAREVKKAYPEAVLIWIAPPSIEELEKRLVSRGSETPESLKSRLGLAIEEISAEKAHPLYAFHVINDDFDRAKQEIAKIILKHL